METLSLEKFNPKKAELTKLCKKYTGLVIKGIDDVEGYNAVNEARKFLGKQRIAIEKQGKEFRAEAVKFQKDVIIYEDSLIDIIRPLEMDLLAKKEAIDLEKHKIEMQELLPDRKNRLAEIEVTLEDDAILSMDIEDFEKFYNEKKAEFLNAKELKLKAEQAKMEQDKKILKAKEDARKEEAEKAQRDIEVAKERAKFEKEEAVRNAELKAKKEKQDIIDENNRKELARLKAEDDKKMEEAEKAGFEKAKKERLEKEKKYQKFLEDNKYEAGSKDFILVNSPSEVTMYKKVAVYKLN